MSQSPVFWAAFWAGLAAPASLYSPPANYWLYSSNASVAQSFAEVAIGLASALGYYIDDGQSPEGRTTTKSA